MSDQSLRAALETELKRQGADEFYRVGELADALAKVAVANPAEATPDRQPSDAAVEAAYAAYSGDTTVSIHDGLRDALVAAYRVDVPRPLLDPDRVAQACGDPGSIVARQDGESLSRWSARAVMELARPMPTREQICMALESVIHPLVRATNPVSGDQGQRILDLNAGKAADAVQALLNGAES